MCSWLSEQPSVSDVRVSSIINRAICERFIIRSPPAKQSTVLHDRTCRQKLFLLLMFVNSLADSEGGVEELQPVFRRRLKMKCEVKTDSSAYDRLYRLC